VGFKTAKKPFARAHWIKSPNTLQTFAHSLNSNGYKIVQVALLSQDQNDWGILIGEKIDKLKAQMKELRGFTHSGPIGDTRKAPLWPIANSCDYPATLRPDLLEGASQVQDRSQFHMRDVPP
jgi:hypothetical protein